MSEDTTKPTSDSPSFFRSGVREPVLLTPGLEPGKIVGDFELRTLLGQGGMGQVWEANQLSLSRQVAVKFVRPERVTKHQLELFAREARAGGRLSHSGIVAVYGHGESDGLAWIAMELVPGAWDLRDFLDEVVRMGDVPEGYDKKVALFIAKVADAVQAAHDAGVIHRDLKPQNILITESDDPKVTDFGLARIVDEQALSHTGDFAGTYFYMSPEQVAAKRAGLDHRTDVFSLGIVLYEMLSLVRPFQGDTEHQVAEQILMRDPADPRTLRSKVPRDLAVICGKCLEKDRERRYRTMTELSSDLRRWIGNEPIHANPPSRFDRFEKWCRRHPTKSAVTAIAVLALGIFSSQFASNVRINRDLLRERNLKEKESLRAVAASKESTRQAYGANIAAAQANLELGLILEARRRLIECAESERGWEWSLLDGMTDSSICSIPIQRPEGIVLQNSNSVIYAYSMHQLLEIDSQSFETIRNEEAENGIFIRGASSNGLLALYNLEDDNLYLARSVDTVLTEIGFADGLPNVIFGPRNEKVLFSQSLSRRGVSQDYGGLWRIDDGRLLSNAPKSPNDLVVSDDLHVVSVGGRLDPSDLEITDWNTGGLVSDWPKISMAYAAAMDSKGKLIAIADLNGLAVYDRESESRLWFHDRNGATESECSEFIFAKNGSLLIGGSEEGSIRVYDSKSGEILQRFRGHSASVVAFENLQNGLLGSISNDDSLKIWDLESGEVFFTGSSKIEAITISNDGKLIGASLRDESVQILSADTGISTAVVQASTAIHPSIEFVGNAGDIVVAVPGSARIHSAHNGALSVQLGEVPIYRSKWYSGFGVDTQVACSKESSPRVAILSCARIQSGGNDPLAGFHSSVDIWRDSELVTHREFPNVVQLMALSVGGEHVALVSQPDSYRRHQILTLFDSNLDVLSVKDLVGSKPGIANTGTCVAFAPDGASIAVGAESGLVSLFSVPDLSLLSQARVHDGPVTCLSWSPDGLRLATGSRDNTLRVLRIPSLDDLIVLRPGHVKDIGWSPSASFLLVAVGDQIFKYESKLSTEEMLRRHKKRVRTIAAYEEARNVVLETMQIDQLPEEKKSASAKERRSMLGLMTVFDYELRAEISGNGRDGWGVAKAISEKRFADALEIARDQCRIRPWAPYSREALGIALYVNDIHDEALLELLRVRELGSMLGSCGLAVLALASHETGDMEQAELALDLFESRYGTKGQYLEQLGDSYPSGKMNEFVSRGWTFVPRAFERIRND